MTGERMWKAYLELHPEDADKAYEAWCYGSDAADELARLTLEGIKTATASAYPLYELEQIPLPSEGEFNMILRTDDTAVCVTKTTRVCVIPYKEVSAEHAYKEGEGDRSLSYWRKVHEEFFAREMEDAGMVFTEEMKVVCEEFEVVYPRK